MATLLQDLRFALRTAAHNRGFTAAVVLSLALGIGANTAIFSLLNTIFLRPLPVEDPDRLVSLYTTDARNPGFNGISFPNYRDYRDESRVFSGLAAYCWNAMSLASGGSPEQVFGQIVTGNYFAVLGVRPLLGRGFLPEEDLTPGSHPVVVLSHRLWKRRFGGDPALVGKEITLDATVFTVVGIAPPAFGGVEVGFHPDLWVPSMMHARVFGDDDPFEERRAVAWNVIGRLAPGISTEQAQGALRTIAERLEKLYPDDNRGRGVRALPLAQVAVAPEARPVVARAGGVLMTMVGLVLLVACANVANLLLARAGARRREIALRLSLGASRRRVVQQMLTESLLLSLMAGVTGLLLGLWTRDLLWGLRPNTPLPVVLDLGFDGRVLLFNAAVSLAAGLLFGLAPAREAARADIVANLKPRAGDGDGRRRFFGMRDALVVSQVAFSLVALVGAGLFLRSLDNTRRIEPGFRKDGLAMLMFNLGAQGYDRAQAEAFERDALERAEAAPGVRSATLTSHLPLFSDSFSRTVFLEGQDAPPEANGRFVLSSVVGPRYFDTLGIPLLRGRALEQGDREGSLRVAVVNETMARTFWPGREAVGRRFRFFGEEPMEVVGIARDSAFGALGEEPRACAYVPLGQHPSSFLSLVVRTDGAPAAVLKAVRRDVQSLDTRLPLFNVTTMKQLVDESLWAATTGTGLLAAFGLLCLGLAAVGLYGVIACSVSQRTREIGVRMGLGAQPLQVMRLVVGRAGLLVVAGIGAGGVLAFGLARLASGLLYGVGAGDGPTFIATSLLLVSVALLASYLPARRATRIDPVGALRAD